MPSTKQPSPRILAKSKAENLRLLREILRRKPYASSAPEYAVTAWEEVRAAVHGKYGEGFNVVKRFHQLLQSKESDLEAETLALLQQINTDTISCRAAASIRPPGPQKRRSSQAAPSQTSPAPGPPPVSPPASATPASPETPLSGRQAKRTKKSTNTDGERGTKRPRRQPVAVDSSAMAPPTTDSGDPVEAESRASTDDGEILVGPDGSAVDASPPSATGAGDGATVAAVRSAAWTGPRANLLRMVNESLAVEQTENVRLVACAENLATCIKDMMEMVAENQRKCQRERQHLLAQAAVDLLKLA